MTAYTITAVPALIGLVFCVMAVAPPPDLEEEAMSARTATGKHRAA